MAARVAFVLGGGGHHGAYEVGILQALIEAEVSHDLIVGTSIGAINGAHVATAVDQPPSRAPTTGERRVLT